MRSRTARDSCSGGSGGVLFVIGMLGTAGSSMTLSGFSLAHQVAIEVILGQVHKFHPVCGCRISSRPEWIPS